MSDNCPFCGHHWQALADLNHSILLEKRLVQSRLEKEEIEASFKAQMANLKYQHEKLRTELEKNHQKAMYHNQTMREFISRMERAIRGDSIYSCHSIIQEIHSLLSLELPR